MDAAKQQSRFVLPDGFKIELVASEATGVPKPVSLAFDDAGRLWTVTATAYPRDLEPEVWTRSGEDRVVVIDSPHRTRPTVRTFASGLVMPLSVLPHGDGAFVAQGPEIFFLSDTDGDGTADQRRTLLRGFGVQDSHTLPHQLVHLPGGRIGFSQGVLNDGVVVDAAGRAQAFPRAIVASVTWQGTDLRFLSTGLNNIWAWEQDRWGRIFVHEANDLGFSLVPFEEDSSYPSFQQTKLHPDSPLHPPTAEGLNLGGTGFCGIAIGDDRSGSFPAPWQGMFFVANPILGKVHAVSGRPRPDGTWEFARQADLLACEDPMFRPVAVAFGPDGALYVTDWYNRIISHNEVARDHPGRDKQHGRIWRVRHASQAVREIPNFVTMASRELPPALTSDSRWAMRAAWHQIALRRDRSLVPEIERLLQDESQPADVKVHAIWSLESLGSFDINLWRRLLAHADPFVRREAVRALGTLRPPFSDVVALLSALESENAWSVRFEVLRTLRRLGISVAPLTWLRRWSDSPATTNKVEGWKGPYLALDGSYQRAFQDFLLNLAESKTQLPVIAESQWSRVIGRRESPVDAAATAVRVGDVRKYLARADVEAGKRMVEALCLTCHSIGTKGVGLAPPLDGSGARDLEGLITAIVAPDAAIEAVFRLYRVVTKRGGTVEGFKQSEIRNTITLQFAGGAQTGIRFADVATAGYIDGRSVMPDVTAGMEAEQVAGVVAYLRTLH